LQANGIPVWVRYADVADETQLRAVVDEMEQQFGALDGVIHCAGKVREAARPLLDLAPADIDEHFRGKVSGALALDRVLAGRDVGFCLLMSSLSSVLGGLGFAAYAAANAVLDGLVRDKRNAGDARWFAINWDGWFFEGPPDGFGMTAEEGMQAFDLALGMRHLPEIICSTGSLEARKRQWLNPAAKPAAPKLYARPEVQSEYVGPRTAMERELVEIWQELLGIEQVGVEDDFFELGGDSLLLVRLLNMMRSRVSAQEATIPLKSLFEYPTIAGIASVIAAHEESQRFASRSSQLRSSAQVAEVGEI
jgi:acyl carrier protein